jgi:hypothetical protein
MANRKRRNRYKKNIKKTYVKTLLKFGLLLVYYTEAKVDLISLFKVGLDLHDLGKGLFGIVVASIAIVENTDSIPKHGVLGIAQVDKSLLVGVVGLLKVFRHQITVAWKEGSG